MYRQVNTELHNNMSNAMKTTFKGPSGVLEYQIQPSGVSDQGWLPLTAGWVGVSHKKRGSGWCSGSRRESARLGVWGCPGKRHRMAWGWDKTENGLVGAGEGVQNGHNPLGGSESRAGQRSWDLLSKPKECGLYPRRNIEVFKQESWNSQFCIVWLL